MIVTGFLCWVIATNVYRYYVKASTIMGGTWTYPSNPSEVPISPYATVRLTFSSNRSTTIYLKHKVSIYRTETIVIASNVTFLDTRFTAAKELGVSSLYTISFIPTAQPTKMKILITYERIHPFHDVFIIFGILSSVLGAIAIAYSVLNLAYTVWKKRRGTQTKANTCDNMSL